MIIYQYDLTGININQLNGFFEGWSNKPDHNKFYEILKKSTYRIIAFDDKEDKITGFITAISDEVFSAYIPLLEVLPEYRNQGIGKKLITKMLSKLGNLYMIDLICDKNLAGYYKKLGFTNTHGMSIRNYESIKD